MGQAAITGLVLSLSALPSLYRLGAPLQVLPALVPGSPLVFRSTVEGSGARVIRAAHSLHALTARFLRLAKCVASEPVAGDVRVCVGREGVAVPAMTAVVTLPVADPLVSV